MYICILNILRLFMLLFFNNVKNVTILNDKLYYFNIRYICGKYIVEIKILV